jgi:class 3 adenylate cyclase
MMFAATHPERVERLVLHGTWLSQAFRIDVEAILDRIERYWGTGSIYGTLSDTLWSTDAGREFLARYERQSATPRLARQIGELAMVTEVRGVVGSISVPTLIVHRRGDATVPIAEAEALAAAIPNARLVTLPGSDHYMLSGDTAQIADVVEEFVTGTPAPTISTERLLATVVLADIVDSTPTAARLGDRAWARKLDDFERLSHDAVAKVRGELVTTTGDGVLAIFDGPGRGVHAATALRDTVAGLGLQLRVGVHTAEIERRGADVVGLGVHVASRVASAATPGEVWVSRTVRDLVAGTGIELEPRGEHVLKGVDEPWALYAVTR